MAAAFGTTTQVWHHILNPRQPAPAAPTLRALVRRLNELVDRDVANVERGDYPRELLFHVPVFEYMRAAPEILGDVPFILRRNWRKRFFELPKDVDLDDYPKYYRQNFHWQTGGWLSRHSARIYDIGVDFLFWGTADAMRRMLIPPLVEELRTRRHARILDVACGTGRFLSQLHVALPHAKLYGVDLSPFYVEQAREVLSNAAAITVTAENAESLPFDDASFDAVTSIYLFHELPRQARRNVWREMCRVVKPGGRVVIADSPQTSDPNSGEIEPLIRLFPTLYHEPYFPDYMRDRLADALPECGLEVEREDHFLVTKVTVARKPA
jgi:ubiquinone/menaquinone biosynthesis C-methylase UbiE